jgi:hypothetical protein
MDHDIRFGGGDTEGAEYLRIAHRNSAIYAEYRIRKKKILGKCCSGDGHISLTPFDEMIGKQFVLQYSKFEAHQSDYISGSRKMQA